MAIKLYYTILFLSLDFAFTFYQYKGVRVKLFHFIFVTFIIIASWIINNRFLLIPVDIFQMLLFFSISLLVIGLFSKLSYTNLGSIIKRIGTMKNGGRFIQYHKKIRIFLVFLLFPIIIFIGQLIILWKQ